MVKSSEHRLDHDGFGDFDGLRGLPWDPLTDALMRPRFVEVLLVLADDPTQMAKNAPKMRSHSI